MSSSPKGDGSAVEVGHELAIAGIDIFDVANIAVIDVLVIIVLDLHDLVAGREGPAESLVGFAFWKMDTSSIVSLS
jgi:hypothetical protein